MPQAPYRVPLPPQEPPRLTVLIDVEEEFDWEAPFDRSNTATSAVSELGRAVDVLAERGLVPVGVVSYPVAADPESARQLRAFVEDGRLQVGAHLHPWVCPPHEEVVSDENSFPGNLDADLEERKLAALTDAIEQAVGQRPRVYQAGRYGLGAGTFDALLRQGYVVDMSRSPGFDYREQGGPDFRRDDNAPRWTEGGLLTLPVTGAYTGALHGAGPVLFPLAQSLAGLKVPALLSRSGLLERQRLSPEGHGLSDMQRLTQALHRQGHRVFCLSFHSPSLAPGHTTYVETESQRDAFVRLLGDYVRWFQDELGGEAATPLSLHEDFVERFPPPARRAPEAPA